MLGEIAASSKVEENVDNPIGPLLYMFSLFYCITTALSQGVSSSPTPPGSAFTTPRPSLVRLRTQEPVGGGRQTSNTLRRHDHPEIGTGSVPGR